MSTFIVFDYIVIVCLVLVFTYVVATTSPSKRRDRMIGCIKDYLSFFLATFLLQSAQNSSVPWVALGWVVVGGRLLVTGIQAYQEEKMERALAH